MTIFELGDDGKIRRKRSYYDDLAIIHRVSNKYPGVKGVGVLKKLVNFLVAQGEKGLERAVAANSA